MKKTKITEQLYFDFADAVPLRRVSECASYEYIAENYQFDMAGIRCGTCASMVTSLPGCCPKEIGRCVDPAGRSYYLKPENTRPNEGMPDDDPGKYPNGGSWAYVARDSCACDKHRPRRKANA